VLLVGLTLIPLAVAGARARWRRAVWLAMGAVVAYNATAQHRERVPAWPSDGVLVGVLAGVGVLVGTVVLVQRLPDTDRALREAPHARSPARRSVTAIALAGTLLIAPVLAGGWFIQRHYLEHRYIHTGLPTDTINAAFRDVRGARVAVFGTYEVYPMFGADLSNRVTKPDARIPNAKPCRQWKQALSHYHYIAVAVYKAKPYPSPYAILFVEFVPSEKWFATDPAATEVVRKGQSRVYRIDGALDASGCSKLGT